MFLGAPGEQLNGAGDSINVFADVEGTVQIGSGIFNCFPAGATLFHCSNTIDMSPYFHGVCYLTFPEIFDPSTGTGYGPILGAGAACPGLTGSFEVVPTELGNFYAGLYFD